jgi:hypothetical protein
MLSQIKHNKTTSPHHGSQPVSAFYHAGWLLNYWLIEIFLLVPVDSPSKSSEFLFTILHFRSLPAIFHEIS